eukprot:187053_1
MGWSKFELSRMNYTVAAYVILISLLQSATFYYLIYLYGIWASQFLFRFSFWTLLLSKLLWLINLEYQIIKYTPPGPHHYWSILLVDLLPLVLFRHRHVWSMTFKRYFFASISHTVVVGTPMAILATIYVVFYKGAPIVAAFLTLALVAFTLPLIFVGQGGVVPSRANAFHLMCLLCDVCKGFLTIYFITNWFFYNQYEGKGSESSLWTLQVIYYASVVFLIKSCIVSPVYTIFLFIFHAFNSPPNCANCSCQWNLLLLAAVPVILVFVWLFVDTIFFSYPLLICYHNLLSYQFELWFNVLDFLHQRVNAYDNRVRLWLFNYLWLIERIYCEEEDPNLMYKQQQSYDQEDEDTDANNEFKPQEQHKLQVQRIPATNEKYLLLLHKVERALIWYLTPKTDEEAKWEEKKYIGLTLQDKEKQIEAEWNERFDLNIFVSEEDKISNLVYEGYNELMHDVLMRFFHLRRIIRVGGTDGNEYDKVRPIADDEGYQCFKCFRKVMENMLIYVLGPIQFLFALYGVIVYPVILSIILVYTLIMSSASPHEIALFWFVNCYYVIIVVMLLLAPYFYEMIKCLWYSLYARDGTWQEQPDKYLAEVYNYIHLNRQRVDTIQQRFGVDHRKIAVCIYEYCGYIAIQCDGRRDYLMTNAIDMLEIVQSSQDEKGEYMKLIKPSQNLLNDTEHKMIIGIQQREHAVRFDGDLSVHYTTSTSRT